MNQIMRKTMAATALVAGGVAAATGLDAARDPIPELDAQSAASAPATLAASFRDASRAALPAVVYVEVQAQARNVAQELPEQLRGTPFEQFFGGPRGSSPTPRRGSGSGFIITPDGYILTNNHVVENATRVTVTLTDKREFEAKVVGRDPNTDVAVLKVDGKNLPVAKMGDAEALQVGDWVLALGYPMSLGETVTAGIVSAMGRSIGIMRASEDAPAPLEHFIQTDAAINPGNSGGPLVNLAGEVIGINTAIASTTGTYAGYGFAVPVTLARRVADDLIRDGVVRRPRLGVQIKPVTVADAEVFGLGAQPRGAVVASAPEGPAKEAGIRLGDVIVSIAGRPIDDTDDLMERIALKQPGEVVQVDLIRYGAKHRVNVRLAAFESAPIADRATTTDSRDPVSRLGFSAATGDGRSGSGVVVTEVDPMGPAAEAGLGRGFRIEQLNGREVRSVEQIRDATARLGANQVVSIVGRTAEGVEAIVNYRIRG